MRTYITAIITLAVCITIGYISASYVLQRINIGIINDTSMGPHTVTQPVISTDNKLVELMTPIQPVKEPQTITIGNNSNCSQYHKIKLSDGSTLPTYQCIDNRETEYSINQLYVQKNQEIVPIQTATGPASTYDNTSISGSGWTYKFIDEQDSLYYTIFEAKNNDETICYITHYRPMSTDSMLLQPATTITRKSLDQKTCRNIHKQPLQPSDMMQLGKLSETTTLYAGAPISGAEFFTTSPLYTYDGQLLQQVHYMGDDTSRLLAKLHWWGDAGSVQLTYFDPTTNTLTKYNSNTLDEISGPTYCTYENYTWDDSNKLFTLSQTLKTDSTNAEKPCLQWQSNPAQQQKEALEQFYRLDTLPSRY